MRLGKFYKEATRIMFGKTWTDQEMLHEFLWAIIQHINTVASKSTEGVREAASSENPNRLRDRLIEIQMAVVGRIFSYIDGTSGPSDWPGINLVNAQTGERLSIDLAWELSSIEGEYLGSNESALKED
jgi:hypothetical protein